MNLRIGSRGSQLALWQANHIKHLLEAEGHTVEIEIIKTTGDRLQAVTFAQVAARAVGLGRVGLLLTGGQELLAVVRARADVTPPAGSGAPRFEVRDALTLAQVATELRRMPRTGLVLVAGQELLALIAAEEGPGTDLGTRVGSALHTASTVAFVSAASATPLGWAGLVGADTPMIIVVDQLEELFTAGADPGAREAFATADRGGAVTPAT